ncbi:MAG: hypothetical protein V4603_01670 [Pseudomonadota bacterium]
MLLALPSVVTEYWQQQDKQQNSELSADERIARAQTLLTAAQGSNYADGYGQAEALLLPLATTMTLMPAQAAYLLAYIKQHNHEFSLARELLNHVLAAQPHHLGALMQRAQINLVTADYAAARGDCATLGAIVSAAQATSCLAQVAAVTGQAEQAYAAVTQLLANPVLRNAAERFELQLTAATVAEQLGKDEAAEGFYIAALAQQADSGFILQHLADLYLRTGQPQAALSLLRGVPVDMRSLEQEVMLLQALQATANQADAAQLQQQLVGKFSEATARGGNGSRANDTPDKELAAFALLQGDAGRALAAAQRNWQAQKESGDLLLLTKAAALADDTGVLRDIRQWQQTTGLQDRRLERLLQEAGV